MEVWLVGLLLALLVTAYNRVRRWRVAGHDLTAMAHSLGLVHVGNELVGLRGDVPVGARLGFEAPDQALVATWTVYARLQPPLDLGLLLHTRAHQLPIPAGAVPVPRTGDLAFDDRFVVVAAEARRAQALLTAPLRRELVDLLDQRALCSLSDAGLAVQLPKPWVDRAWLAETLAHVGSLARRLNEARPRVPVAAALVSHHAAWRRFAADNGLVLVAAPLCMYGTIEGSTVYAYAVRLDHDRHGLEIWLRFGEPLGIGVLLQPKRTVDRIKGLAGAGLEIGDEMFDRTFHVAAVDAKAARALLDPELRAALCELHASLAPVSLTDEGVSVRLADFPAHPRVVPSIVRRLIVVAQVVADKHGRRQRSGPYR